MNNFSSPMSYATELEVKRRLLAQQAVNKYRYAKFKSLAYRNLRKDFYDHGLIPRAYFSYCLNPLHAFREKSSLHQTLEDMIDMGMIAQVTPAFAAAETGLDIDRKSKLYVATEDTDAAYREELTWLVDQGIRFPPPFKHQPQWLLADLNRLRDAGKKPRPSHDKWKPFEVFINDCKRAGLLPKAA